MKFVKLSLASLALSLLVGTSVAKKSVVICEEGGFIPKEYEFKLLEESSNGMTEIEFNRVIDRISEVYAPIFQAQGSKFVAVKHWDDDTVNAVAYKDDINNISYIEMFGGLARHQYTTPDSLAVVMCHEIGHHLGQAPIYTGSEMSTEGQSDYYSTLKCFRKVFGNEDSMRALSNSRIPAQVVGKCNFYFQEPNERALCMRAALAGLQGAWVLSDAIYIATGTKYPVDAEGVDPKVVSKTYEGHPLPQCRYDTYLAGAACPVNSDVPLSPSDENYGLCSVHNGTTFQAASRPLCWYKPNKSAAIFASSN